MRFEYLHCQEGNEEKFGWVWVKGMVISGVERETPSSYGEKLLAGRKTSSKEEKCLQVGMKTASRLGEKLPRGRENSTGRKTAPSRKKKSLQGEKETPAR